MTRPYVVVHDLMVVNKRCLLFRKFCKPIKRQDLLEKGKTGRNAFRTGAKIHFSEKNYFGVRGTLIVKTKFK